MFRIFSKQKVCSICDKRSNLISRALGVCGDCIRQHPEDARPYVLQTHRRSRSSYGLPHRPPEDSDGIHCTLCANECLIGENEKGYCGLRANKKGKLRSKVNSRKALLYTYLDPHVTNCCAAWFCPAGTGVGYPQFAYAKGPEYGYSNLAVFFYGCNFDCLFCQNASHKNLWEGGTMTVDAFSTQASLKRISCICYFGGSPEPQLPFAIEASRRVLEENSKRIIRICFEWNGCGNPQLVKRAAELVSQSGGNIKFDLKCFHPSMSLALSGVSNERAYTNFQMLAEEFFEEREVYPFLTATTLLVPGYVDSDEVRSIAKFIADVNIDIPYSLLVFSPHHEMRDLPITPQKQILNCYQIAKKHLRRVTVANLHLIGLKIPRS